MPARMYPAGHNSDLVPVLCSEDEYTRSRWPPCDDRPRLGDHPNPGQYPRAPPTARCSVARQDAPSRAGGGPVRGDAQPGVAISLPEKRRSQVSYTMYSEARGRLEYAFMMRGASGNKPEAPFLDSAGPVLWDDSSASLRGAWWKCCGVITKSSHSFTRRPSQDHIVHLGTTTMRLLARNKED
jgi:hypothetical protein